MTDAAYTGWLADERAGQVSLLVAADNATVAGLNARARGERQTAGHVEAGGVRLHDGTTAGVGDRVVSRRNERTLLTFGGRDFLKNGDLWTVERRHGGALTVRNTRHHGRVRLPAAYVSSHVELGYATTAHRAQGMTVDSCHLIAADPLARELLYVGMTRGVRANTVYVITEPPLDPGLDRPPAEPVSAREVLARILTRSGAERSATETARTARAEEVSMGTLLARYQYASKLAQTPGHRIALGRAVAGPAAAAALDADLDRYLAQLRQQIDARARILAERAIGERPGWLRRLGQPPHDGPARMRYLAAVAEVAGYREAYGVHDHHPVGERRPKDAAQVRRWARACRAVSDVRRLAQQHPYPASPANGLWGVDPLLVDPLAAEPANSRSPAMGR